MEEKKSSLRAESSKNRDFDDDSKLTLLFTAGTTVLAVCLKRATVVFLLKQWQLWVFLVLNVLLLAILFTSFCSTTPTKSHGSSKRGRKRAPSRPNLDAVEEEETVTNYNYSKFKEPELPSNDSESWIKVDTVDVCALSDEELNERVESFIASFKQQLVLDARKMTREAISTLNSCS